MVHKGDASQKPIIHLGKDGGNRRRLLFILPAFCLGAVIAFMLISGPVRAQEPAGDGQGPTPTVTPALELTGAGWLEVSRPSPGSDVSALALSPVNCASFTSPIVGYEISKGQDSNDITDLANDLVVNGFSVGTVDLSTGSIPSCVDVLIIQGVAQNLALSAAYTAAEGALLKTWTSAGHGLLLSGEWGTFRAEVEALFQAYGYSQQGSNGVTDLADTDPVDTSNTWVIYQTDNFGNHPILNGVNSLELLTSSWLSSAANAVVTTDADATPPAEPVIAAFDDGAGCVVLVADSNWNTVMGSVDGYFKQDNATFARQVVQWLNSCSTLTLTKSAVPNPITAGQIVTYVLTATNQSAPSVTNVRITDTVPVSTSFVAASLPHIGPDANGVVTWSLGSLNFNTSAVVTMAVQVDNSAPNGTLIPNTGWLASNQGLTATATVAINVIAASTPATVTGLIWEDLNGDAVYDSGTEQLLPIITVVITDSTGIPHTLATDANGRYTISVASGSVIIDVDQTDPNLPLNSILTTLNDPHIGTAAAGSTLTANFGFQPQLVLPQLHLDLRKLPPDTVSPGDILSYTVVFSNSGAITATNVVITDFMPLNTTYEPGSVSSTACSIEFFDGTNWVVAESLPVLGIRCLLQQLSPNRIDYQFNFATRIDPNLSATVGTIFDEAALSSNETPPQTDAEISPIIRQNPIPPVPLPPRPDDNDDADQDDPVSDQNNTEAPTSVPTSTIVKAQATPMMPVQFLPDTGLREATPPNNSTSKPITFSMILIGLSLIVLWKWLKRW